MLCAWEAWTRTAVNEKINISFASASLRAERTADNKGEHHDANLRASRTAYGPAPTGGIGDCSARLCEANAGGLRRDRSARRSGVRRGSARSISRAGAVADLVPFPARLRGDAERRPGLSVSGCVWRPHPRAQLEQWRAGGPRNADRVR